MFQRKKNYDLPMATGGGNAHLKSAANIGNPKIQGYTIASWCWLVGSISLLLVGIFYCTKSTEIRTLVCGPEMCTVTVQSQVSPDESLDVRFAREDLVKAEAVRIRNGKIRDTRNMKRKAARKLGHTYAITFKENGEEREPLVMSTNSLGRKRPRSAVTALENYMRRETDEVDLSEESGFDWRGLLGVLFGLFSLLFCVLLGQFSDPKPTPRRIVRKR